MANLKIKTLQNSSVPVITDVFNRAFADYMLPLQMTETAMRRKISGDQIDLRLSPGCFIDGELCGFILHGIGQRESQMVAWNGGTGVIPIHRGQGITSRLYDFIIPELCKKGCAASVLEAIDANMPAIHVYQRNGFESTRKLVCYKGDVLSHEVPRDIELKTISKIDWERFQTFWSWQPSFQNAKHKLLQLRNEVQIVGAFKTGNPVGYITFEKSQGLGDVYQFAVDKNFRGIGIGTAMFASAAANKTVPLKVVNVDASHTQSNAFLENLGLQQTASQIEMVREF